MDAKTLELIILPAGLIAILFALYLARDVLRRDSGTQAMQDVAGHDLRRRGRVHPAPVLDDRDPRRRRRGGHRRRHHARRDAGRRRCPEARRAPDRDHDRGRVPGRRACSMASGIIGMFVSVKSNVRTASAARRSLVEAVQVAMRGGAVSGFLVVALSLLGVWGIFTVYSTFVGDVTVAEAPFLIVGFGFGASFVALFAQLGGGIYTKAADVGSDLVGKVEAGHPRGRPAQRGRHRRPRRRQRRRLRRPRRRPVRVDRGREHRRDDPRRRGLHDRCGRRLAEPRRPGSSSRSSSARSACSPRSSRSSSSAVARTRTR